MIKVFAFEPEAIFDPQLRQALEQFGFDHGRLVARVPKDWSSKVTDIFRSQHSQNKRMDVFLERFHKKRATIKVRLPETASASWIEKAMATAPNIVDGIICSENTYVANKDLRVLCAADLHDDNQVWHIETGQRIHRSAEEMADCIRVLLRHSSVIKFIDPYLTSEPRYTSFIDRCCKILQNERQNRKTYVEFHHHFKSNPVDDLAEIKSRSKSTFENTASSLKGLFE